MLSKFKVKIYHVLKILGSEKSDSKIIHGLKNFRLKTFKLFKI